MKTRPLPSLALSGTLALLPLGSLALAQPNPNQLLNLRGIPKTERTILPLAFTWPQNAGEAALCLWKDDKTAALSYTIDDNNAMNIDWWLQETAQRDIKVTWFLVASGISSSNPTMSGTWAGWQVVRDAGHALESHTMTHLSGSRNPDTWQGLEWEYNGSKIRIQDNIGGGHLVSTLAYPGGSYPATNDPSLAAQFYSAARGTKGTLNGPQGLDYLGINAMSKANFGTQPQNSFSNADNLFNPAYTQGYRGWCVIIYHHIKQSDAAIVAKTRTELDYAVTHREDLWTGRFNDIARYAQSRETSALTVTENTATRIALNLTDRMNDTVFDFPLTVKVRLPATWSSVAAAQGGTTPAVDIVEHGGAKFALVDVVPDRGEAVLTPANSLHSSDIGNPSLSGSTTAGTGSGGGTQYTLQAAGTDIWGASDQFHYAHRTLTGDGEIIARVASVAQVSPYSKAGIMMRETLAGNSRNVAITARVGANRFHHRALPGGETIALGDGPGIPQWLRLVRTGSNFTGYRSANGVNWTSIGTTTVAMGSTIHVGMVATSRNAGARTTAVLDGFQVVGAP